MAEGTAHPAYLLYRGGRALASAVPEAISFPAAELVGLLVGRVNAKRREVVRRNLARVVDRPGLERAVDAAFRSYARYWVETLRIPKPGTDEIRRRTSFEGLDALRSRLEGGQGVVFCTPHLGSWDVAAAWFASQGFRVVVVAEALEPPALFDLFASLRRDVGLEVHPLGTGASARALLTGLREGAAIGLVADRDITGSGVEVSFFGEKTFLPQGPAVLAIRTGCPIACGALYQRPGRRYHGVILDPIEPPSSRDPGSVRELSQQVASDLERLIRREPGQWHLFQPNWPTDPGYRRGA